MSRVSRVVGEECSMKSLECGALGLRASCGQESQKKPFNDYSPLTIVLYGRAISTKGRQFHSALWISTYIKVDKETTGSSTRELA